MGWSMAGRLSPKLQGIRQSLFVRSHEVGKVLSRSRISENCGKNFEVRNRMNEKRTLINNSPSSEFMVWFKGIGSSGA